MPLSYNVNVNIYFTGDGDGDADNTNDGDESKYIRIKTGMVTTTMTVYKDTNIRSKKNDNIDNNNLVQENSAEDDTYSNVTNSNN